MRLHTEVESDTLERETSRLILLQTSCSLKKSYTFTCDSVLIRRIAQTFCKKGLSQKAFEMPAN